MNRVVDRTRGFSGARRWRRCAVGLIASLFAGVAPVSLCGAELTPESVEFFESRIRPVLVEKCYRCHSEATGTTESGLALDSRAGVLAGGDRGDSIVPGKPDQSPLIDALKYDDESLQMPPEEAGGKLDDHQIADFVQWIRIGAPDPRTEHVVAASNDWATAEEHWAFTPIVKPETPDRSDMGVDAFVIEQLQQAGLELNPPADRRTLLRRITYDLTGLPPTHEQLVDFDSDPSAEAYAKVVDRLLASPEYGERWGRHWLDVARYADTRGYRTGGKQERYPFSHVYRDYVIDSFNEDKPYDQFLIEQIAADQLDLGDDRSALAAMGFLTLGRRFIDNAHLIIDDRIDVVTRGLMGLTVTCARCHDHKFDPIPTADYYSLYGVFASSHEPDVAPLIEALQETDEYLSYTAAKGKLEDDIERIRNKRIDKYLDEQRGKVGDYLLAAVDAESLDASVTLEEFAGKRDVDVRLLRRWIETLKQQPAHPALVAWLRVQGEDNGQTDVEGIESLANALPNDGSQSLRDAADTYNKLCAAAVAERAEDDPLWAYLNSDACPSNPGRDEVGGWLRRIISNETAGKRREIESLNWTHDGAPKRAPVLVDRPKPRNTRIFQRGDPRSPGEEVPRQFVRVLAGPDRQPFTAGSGRMELARAIASASNPLTPRVLVNRVWGWHFGAPIVRTASDFGVRTERPRHARLLDWLAATFIDSGWSIKELHRQIVMSKTYRQSSEIRPDAEAMDPENRLMHRFQRRRLGFEAMRDTILDVAGTLDRTRGGISVDVTRYPCPPRRTVYAFVDRQNLPGLLRTFDYPSPDATSPGRFHTTVPQQALFMLNSPFVVEQAKSLAKRAVDSADDDQQRVRWTYRRLFQREPDGLETKLALRFLSDGDRQREDQLSRWELYAQTLLSSNELMFVD